MNCREFFYRYRIDLALIAVLVFTLYGGILAGMSADWYSNENYSHGFLVPFIAGYLVYQRRGELALCPVKPSGWGLTIVLLALIQLVIGTLAREQFTVRSSLLPLLSGILLYFLGRKSCRMLLLPLIYLIFMIPLPYLVHDAIGFPLRQFVSVVSVWFMKIIGLTVLREGNIIMFPAFSLEVADACSGIRSLISILALSVAMAFILPFSSGRRFILVLAAVPVALATNALRVIMTGILGRYIGVGAAQGFFHEFAGMAIFVLAMLLLGALAMLLLRCRQ